MGRPLRMARGEFVYHVLNRANGRVPLFNDDGDYAAFDRVLAEACERVSMRMLAYCVMPNHWHLVLWPRQDGALSRFMGWLTLTHTQRWHAQHHTSGHGHLYQGRFKSFAIEQNDHLLTLCRAQCAARRARGASRAVAMGQCVAPCRGNQPRAAERVARRTTG
jgi:putative transposase